MHVLVTGAAGSIGLELCRELVGLAVRRIVLLDHSEAALAIASRAMDAAAVGTDTEVVTILGSVGDDPLVRDLLRAFRPGAVFHAAAYKHVPIVEANPRVGFANNTLATLSFARACRDARAGRFVLVSSDKAARPQGVLGASKRLAEIAVRDLAGRERETVFSAVRFGNVAGSSGSVIPLLRDQIARGGPLTLTDPGATRYFMTAGAAAGLVLAAGLRARQGDVLALDMGPPVRIGDLAAALVAEAGLRLRTPHCPEGEIETVTIGLRPGEKRHETVDLAGAVPLEGLPTVLRLDVPQPSEIEVAALMRDLREAVDRGDSDALRGFVARVAEIDRTDGLPTGSARQRGWTGREGQR